LGKDALFLAQKSMLINVHARVNAFESKLLKYTSRQDCANKRDDRYYLKFLWNYKGLHKEKGQGILRWHTLCVKAVQFKAECSKNRND
jgi:hypothetical protein